MKIYSKVSKLLFRTFLSTLTKDFIYISSTNKIYTVLTQLANQILNAVKFYIIFAPHKDLVLINLLLDFGKALI